MQSNPFDQKPFDIRCEWGLQGIETLTPVSDVVIIVDVLSFSTCVDVAVSRGAFIYPYRWKDRSAAGFAREVNALLASFNRNFDEEGYSLSPASMLEIPAGTGLVLPSPNGATLTLRTGDTPTLSACLRNYRAVAQRAMTIGTKIAVIPAGEKWPDQSLRPSLEDWMGAGAVISQLEGKRSPESEAARLCFEAGQARIPQILKGSSSARELILRGFEKDVDLALELDVSTCAPRLQNLRFVSD